MLKIADVSTKGLGGWWFMHFPIHRGKGLLLRQVILPALPPKPAGFAYRLRSGDYRILFDIEGNTVIVQTIKNRKEAYD